MAGCINPVSCNNCNETEIEFYPDEVVAVVRGAFGEGGTAFDTAAWPFPNHLI